MPAVVATASTTGTVIASAQSALRITWRRARRRTARSAATSRRLPRRLEVRRERHPAPWSSSGQRPQRARDAQAGGVLAAAEPAGHLLVVELLDDAQLEGGPLVGRQQAHGGGERRGQRAGGDALVDGLVLVALGERGGSPSRSRAAVSMRLCLWYWRSRLRAMPNSHGAPEPSAMSRKRRSECHAWANVSAVRSSAALSEPVWRANQTRTQTA